MSDEFHRECPECHAPSITQSQNARALFRIIECPACGTRLRVKWADPMRVFGVMLVLALALIGFRFRAVVTSAQLAGLLLLLAAVNVSTIAPGMRRLPLAKVQTRS
jgi:endogenous inhibitor of DNA gyrase (YacG/DUF329 family)